VAIISAFDDDHQKPQVSAIDNVKRNAFSGCNSFFVCNALTGI